MKVQVTLSDELVEKIDEYAKKMGVSRSALCGVWIGQAIISLETTLSNSQSFFSDLVAKMDKSKLDTFVKK